MLKTPVISILVSVVFSSLSFAAQAQVVTEKLQWVQLPQNASGPGKLPNPDVSLTKALGGPLAQQKKMENERKWGECLTMARANFGKYSTIKGWILPSWLRCAREFSVEKKGTESLALALKTVDSNGALLQVGPWKVAIFNEMVKARFALMDLLDKSNTAEIWRQVDLLLEQKDRLDRAQRAKVYEKAGEMAQAKAQLKAAQFFYEESLSEQDAKAARDKLSSILFALNDKAPEKKAATESEEKNLLSENEEKFEDRIRASVKANDSMVLLEDCLSYLKQFPTGRRAKWAQEKVLDIYSGLLEMSTSDAEKSDRAQALQNRALNLMERADSLRIMDWARQLHRKSDYTGSQRLAEKALENLSTSSSASVLLYVAGRSAEIRGDYRKARKFFEQYVEAHSGGEEIIEVLFRLGLTHIRLGQASSALAVFEKLLAQKNIDRYELSARYWLVRCLQSTNNTRALVEADAILTKYPFSYYGLRLRLERAGGYLEWPTPLTSTKPMAGDYYLAPAQKKILDRIQLLASNGWFYEATQELSDLPTPNEAMVKVLLAKKFTDLHLYPLAIRMINEAGDLDPELRSLDIVSLSFPLVYKNLIDTQSAKQKLNPTLVRSLIRQESAFGLRAVSSSNALGLMQLIPPTAQEVATELGMRNVLIPEDVFLPETNVQMGTYYIAKMIRQFGGNVPMGLAAYNAGPTRMNGFVKARPEIRELMGQPSSDPWDEIWFDELPWYETSFYVKAILRNAMLYRVSEKTIESGLASQADQRRVQFGSVLWSDLVLP